jgi:hypothetical protein
MILEEARLLYEAR